MLRLGWHPFYNLIFKLLVTHHYHNNYLLFGHLPYCYWNEIPGESAHTLIGHRSVICAQLHFHPVSGSHLHTAWCSRLPLSLFHCSEVLEMIWAGWLVSWVSSYSTRCCTIALRYIPSWEQLPLRLLVKMQSEMEMETVNGNLKWKL